MEHIYVAAGCAGLLKVGKTANPKVRHRGLSAEFRRKGDALEKFHACGPLPHAYGAERGLIEAVGSRCQRAFGREWFAHGNFSLAVRAAEELTEHYAKELVNWKPYTVTAADEEFRARAAKYKADLAAWRAQAEIATRQRRRLRNAGLHAFGRICEDLRPDIDWSVLRQPHPQGRPCIDVARPAPADVQEVSHAA